MYNENEKERKKHKHDYRWTPQSNIFECMTIDQMDTYASELLQGGFRAMKIDHQY